ncbi:hypothetical protein Q4566_07150 [Tamlana sp. 2_MG-2023]|uniref:hypothetical protein n=1 Tax=unclassified Tamlana TaxID=2614803 RepID=UPI0026E40379|nr:MULTISPECIES: hypothetical protein [unclassified Tamlana]MDO6759973.1 hypothetical protein [Tamlana sp. 2_MG-2023]MDO6791857.1 hypothetical protein [Tamlana sp. 1_MG-2023]
MGNSKQDYIKQIVEELEVVLANKKPFQYFKNKVESSDFRQSRFEFKQKKLEEHVANILDINI